ncbi:MAG: fibronectin type III domain-containing protein [Bacteroidales bacterium]|nr:fibronectin type III domain-containing protein [Bacteroidales bacterium]
MSTNATRVAWGEVDEFPAGLTYTFSLPDPCAVPTYVVTDIKLTPKSDEMGIEVLVDTTGKQADGILLIASEQPVTADPAGGNFVKGQEALGGIVLAVGSWDDFDFKRMDRTHLTFTHPANVKDDRLLPNTTYHYTVYMANTKGCVARYAAPASKAGATATTAPAELKLTESSLNQVKFSAKANDLNEQIAILMTTGKGEDRFNNVGAANRGNFAEIPADAKVGDKFTVSYKYMGNEIIDTSEVLYVGAAGTAIACAVALENNRVYYFGAVSKGKDNGAYSTVVAHAEPYLTPAALPFTDNFSKNFASSPEYEDENGNLITEKVFIGGWAGTTKFELSSSSKTIDGVVSTLKEEPGEAVLMIPALDFPTDSNVLVNIGMNTVYWKGYQTSSFYVADWKEGDSICLEISKDGGKTFEFVKVIHKETDSKNLNNIVLKDYVGVKQAILRLRVKAAAGDKLLNAKVSKISITALPFCPAPKNLRVSTVYGGTLGLTWQAGENGEKQWNISTAAAVAEGQEAAWSRPALVEQQPYYLTGLADQEVYNVRVQAVCEGGRTSGWAEGQVQAGRVPSFTEDFNTEEEPDNWQFGCAYKSPDWYTNWYSNYAKYYQYMTKEAATEGNGALAYDMQHYYKGYYSSYNYNYLIQTPMVELNPAEKPQLTFDAAFGSWVNDEFVAMSAENQKDTMHLAMWVCDSGRFNIESAPAKEWRIAELVTWSAGKTLTVDLSEFVTEAKVVSVAMAVYTEPVAASETHMLYLDNIGIVNTAPLARSVKVAKLGAEEATIQWVADKNVEKWLVKLEGGSLTAPRFFEDVACNTQVIDGLEAEKTYTVSVTPASNGQAAAAERWVSVQFTTLAASCPEPTALAVTSIAQKTAVLTWQGEAADGYYVRYRPVAAQGAEAMPWIEARVKEGTSYTLSGLTPGTKYECEVQGVCSEVAEFYSEWVALEGGFTTRAITCFAPTELRCPESTIGTKTAKVSWTGTSAGYQVAWAVSNSDNWTYGEVVSEAAYTIKGLNYSSWYTFKVRGVCAADDSSEWSETRNFRTLARPACANPTNLRVESLTQTSADLKWDYAEAEEGDLASFTLRHREASVQAWDSIREVEGTTYAIKDMKPQTAYIWNVMALCQDDRSSEWLNLRFTTLAADTVPGNDTTAVEDLKLATGLYVAASQGQIHVMNPKSVRIDNIRIYGLSGQRLEQYAIRSTDHVILTTAVRQRVAIVEVESEGRFVGVKVLVA